MGRPVARKPKDKWFKLRISEDDDEKINYISQETGLNKSEVIGKGIDIQYIELKRNK